MPVVPGAVGAGLAHALGEWTGWPGEALVWDVVEVAHEFHRSQVQPGFLRVTTAPAFVAHVGRNHLSADAFPPCRRVSIHLDAGATAIRARLVTG